MKLIFDGNKLIEESMVKTFPKKIDEQIIIFLENFKSMKKYFDDDGWSLFAIQLILAVSVRNGFMTDVSKQLKRI